MKLLPILGIVLFLSTYVHAMEVEPLGPVVIEIDNESLQKMEMERAEQRQMEEAQLQLEKEEANKSLINKIFIGAGSLLALILVIVIFYRLFRRKKAKPQQDEFEALIKNS